MAGNNSVVSTGAIVEIGATPEGKAMLLSAAGLTPAQVECQLEYGEYAASDANQPVADGGPGHVDGGVVLAPRAAKGPYDNYDFTPIDTKPRVLGY